MSGTLAIEVRDVYKSFKKVHAVQGVDLRISKGQFVAILGPNGAGKTTLVEMIEGIQKPDKGEILVMGRHWKNHEDELHRLIGLSLQETRFIDKLRVIETLRLFASFYELGADRVEEIILITGLEEKRKALVVNLSGGQRQRLAIGIALLNEPAILLLDEPTTGLDPNARREIWSILLKQKEKSGTSMILTTHYMEEAEQLCDYIIIMDHGKILKEGTLQQLLDGGGKGKVVEFSLSGEPSAALVEETFGTMDLRYDPASCKGSVTVKEVERELPHFFDLAKSRDLQIKGLEFRRKTLDDLFTELTGRHLNE